MSKEKYYFSKSLEKGLKILALFNGDVPVLSQSQIAKKLELNPTSTYRYINTLVEMGYLEKDSKTKEIRPSIMCLLFCTNLMRATDHLRMIKEVVDQIHSEYNFSIEVAFAIDDTLVRLYQRQAEEILIYSLPDFTKSCLHNTALGKAYLSSLPHDRMSQKINSLELLAKTPNTIVDKNILLKQVQEIKSCGFSLNNEEYLIGLISIGAPLIDPIQQKGVGAVSFDFSILQHSPDEIKEKYGDLIMETGRRLSELLPPDNLRRQSITDGRLIN